MMTILRSRTADDLDFYGNKKVGDLFKTAMEKEGFHIDLFDYSVHFPSADATTKEFLEFIKIAQELEANR